MTTEERPLILKILTVNTHKGFTFFNRRFILHELRDAIRETQADVVFLQEVLGLHHHHARELARWPTTSQYEFLADSIWSDFAYGRNAVYPEGHHGNALLSKFPITRFENVDISVDRHERRGMLHCVLRPAGAHPDLHAICVHLGLREGHRRLQLTRLCAFIEHKVPRDAPLFVAGDFNDWRLRGQTMLTRTCGLREVFCEHFGMVAKTFPARFPILRLDRIYVRNVAGFQAMRLASRPWTHLSDHAPLVAEVAV
jgi:endonuclease/exonuclease/phosphatase family metal-dependent hydrolase